MSSQKICFLSTRINFNRDSFVIKVYQIILPFSICCQSWQSTNSIDTFININASLQEFIMHTVDLESFGVKKLCKAHTSMKLKHTTFLL